MTNGDVESSTPGRGEAWRRAGLTLVLIVASRALAWIPLPYLDAITGGAFALVSRKINVRELGLLGVAEGFIAVELVALLAQRLRRRRHGTAQERAGLTRAGWLVGLAIVAVQAMALVRYLASMGNLELSAVDLLVGLPMYGAAVLSLVAGTGILCLLARTITRRGLGNGLAVLLTADVVAAVVAARASMLPLLTRYAVPVLVAATVAILFLRAVAARAPDGAKVPARVPVPTSGLIPLPLASWIALLLAGVTPWIEDGWLVTRRWSHGERLLDGAVVALVAAVLLAPLCAWLFTRTARVEASWAAAGQVDAGAVQAAVCRAHRRSFVLVAALAAVPLAWPLLGAPLAVSAVGLYVAAQVVTTALDVVAEGRARARLGSLVPAFPFQRVYAAEAALAALAAAGIPAFARARRFRAIEQLFAPYAPVELLVPPARVEEAVAICAPIAWPEGPASGAAATKRRSVAR